MSSNDLPYVEERHDLEAEVMQQAADPLKVLDVLQENLERELANESPTENETSSMPDSDA